MFQTLALNVNEYLRDNVQSQNNYVPARMNTTENRDLYQKLASNENKTKIFLDNIWKKFGNFSENSDMQIGVYDAIHLKIETNKYITPQIIKAEMIFFP